ncbi:hypothetical protein O3Q50_12910 [Enterococcus lactis]
MTKQLNHSLNKFHLRIVSVQNCCVLEGNELSIRLYLYFFLSDTFEGDDWPFSSLELNTLKKKSKDEHREKIQNKKKTSIYYLLYSYVVTDNRHVFRKFLLKLLN